MVVLRVCIRPIYQTRLRCVDVVRVYFAHQVLSVISLPLPPKRPCLQGAALRSIIRNSPLTNLYNPIPHELTTLSTLRPLQSKSSRKMVHYSSKLIYPLRHPNRLTGLKVGHRTRLREVILALINRFYARSRSPFGRHFNAVSITYYSESIPSTYSVTHTPIEVVYGSYQFVWFILSSLVKYLAQTMYELSNEPFRGPKRISILSAMRKAYHFFSDLAGVAAAGFSRMVLSSGAVTFRVASTFC